MPSLGDLESAVGKPSARWDESDVAKVIDKASSGDASVLSCISDRSVLRGICESGSPEAKQAFLPILEMAQTISGIDEVSKPLREFSSGHDRKKLLEDLRKLMSDGDLLVRLPAYLAAISMFSDYDISAEFGQAVPKDLEAAERRIEEIPPESGHEAAVRMLDFVYPLRARWFYRYGSDPMPKGSSDALSAYQAKLDAFTLFVNEVEGSKTEFPDPHAALRGMGVIDPGDIAAAENKIKSGSEGAEKEEGAK